MTHARFLIQAKSDATGSLPLTRFGHGSFDGCTVDGKSLGRQSPRRLVMVTQDKVVRAIPSAITTSGAFDVTWKHR